MSRKRTEKGEQSTGECRPFRSPSAVRCPPRRRGFTLIELMVVAAIIILVSSVILANNNKFGGVVQLDNLSYEIALTVRQAQEYGISVQRYGTDNFNAGYGVHFDSSDPTHYELFADVYPAIADGGPDGVFEANQGELVQQNTINQGYYIEELCVTPSSGVEDCGSDVQSLDVLFIRPEPDACISYDGTKSVVVQSGIESCTSTNLQARIVLESPRGDTMSVDIYSNGQISVHTP